MEKARDTLALSIGWWLAFVMLAPLLWVQGHWARRVTPRLDPPQGPLEGQAGEGDHELGLLVLGESPAAGIGVATREESLPACLARELSQRHRRRVRWRSLAVNGADIRAVIESQLAVLPAESPDLVVVVLGVNDTTGLTSRRRWRARIIELHDRIRTQSTAPVLFASLPRMDSFTALPQPLRRVLGLRARLLDHDLRAVVTTVTGATCASPLPPLTAAQLSADRYHPSASACVDWAKQLADCLLSPDLDKRIAS